MGARFVLKKVVFEENSWRKLSGLEIPVFPRMTVIAGHNGIGKSSILGFIANASGLLARDIDGRKSYFETEFISRFEQQFRLTSADVSAGEDDKGNILLEYEVEIGQVLKVCNIGQTKMPSGAPRYRVVPRTRGDEEFAERMGVKKDGKIPMPTLFVSAARTWPIGESPKVKVSKSSLDPEDAEFIRIFHNHLVPGEAVDSSASELDLGLSEGRVIRSQHPKYDYDTTAISLGQGAIASIATALASFKRLKRQLKHDYPGGILVVDEIEAGLHPRAQIKLVDLLMRIGKELSLQIVFTTHSLVFLEKFYEATIGREAIDGIVYIMDTKKPQVRRLTLNEMYEEMTLSKTAFAKRKKPSIMVYAEDAEGLAFLRRIVTKVSNVNEKSLGVKVKKVPLGIGCNQLIKLAKTKQAVHFSQHSICILDGDVANKDIDGLDNCLKLPTEAGIPRSPEQELLYFLSKADEDTKGIGRERNALLTEGVTWDWIHNELQGVNVALSKTGKDEKKRDILKRWFRRLSVIKRDKIIDAWINVHASEIQGFGVRYQHALFNAKSKLV